MTATTAASAALWPATLATATVSGSQISLGFSDGSKRSFPQIWLRDNCVCDQCRIVSTGEHRYFLGTVEELPSATGATMHDNDLRIDWSDGHTSTFTAHDFAALTATARRSHRPRQAWAADFTPPRFDHDELFSTDAVRIEMLATFLEVGAVLITGMPNEPGECARFLERLAVPLRDTPFDRVHDVFFRSDGYNVAHTDEPLPPHNDFASYQWPPSGQLLHFLVNEVEGGDSVLVDGWQVLADLRTEHPHAVDVLARVPIAFREHSDTAESWTRAPMVRLDSHDEIVGFRFSNQLMQPLDPTLPEVAEWYQAYHLLSRRLADPANQVSFRTNAGEMQMLHAHRVLHARRGFDGTTGARHLQDTYFEYDDIASLHALTTGENP